MTTAEDFFLTAIDCEQTPMSARLRPNNVQPTRISLHDSEAETLESDGAPMEAVRHRVPPTIERKPRVVVWSVNDDGVIEKGWHSVGVARQDCGRIGAGTTTA
jgi:SRSO17 transposase